MLYTDTLFFAIVVLIVLLLQCPGTQSQVHAAIDMMKQRFPPRQFPGITWEQLNVAEAPVLPPEIMQVMKFNLKDTWFYVIRVDIHNL